MQRSKSVYRENGPLGVLANLAESKLVFEDEYALLLEAVTAPGHSRVPGCEELVRGMNEGAQAFTSEDLFHLIGLLAKVCARDGKGLKQVKVQGELAKLPLGASQEAHAGPGWLRAPRWKSRFFRLAGNGLSYFAKEADAKPKGQLVLTSNSHLRDSEHPGRAHCFDLITQTGTLRVSTSSEHEKEVWVCAMARAIHGARAGPGARESGLANQVTLTLAQGDIACVHEQAAAVRQRRARSSQDPDANNLAAVLSGLPPKGKNRRWKEKYFVLYRSLLSVFDNEVDKRSKGDFILDMGAIVVLGLPADMADAPLGDGIESHLCFHVNLEGLTHTSVILAASSTEQRDLWVSALRTAIDASADHLFSETAPLALSVAADARHANPGGNADTHANGSANGYANANANANVDADADAHVRGRAESGRSAASSINSAASAERRIEVILTEGARQASAARSVGSVPWLDPEDSLAKVRLRLHGELDLPAHFSFLMRLGRSVRPPKALPPKDDALTRFLASDYTKVSNAQEHELELERLVHEEAPRLFLHAVAQAAAEPTPVVAAPVVAAPAASVPSPPPAQVAADSDSGSDSNSNSNSNSESKVVAAAVAEERSNWERQVRKLRSELADARSTIAALQRQQQQNQNQSGSSSASASAGRTLCPLESLLLGLQRDGYVEEAVSTRELTRAFKRLFSADDVSAVLTASDGPFGGLLRRHAADPEHIRGFLEALEQLMKVHIIPSSRLAQPWWKKKLLDPTVLKMGANELAAWAKGEPWTHDTPERYAYLMGKMRPGAVTEAQMTLLHPSPEHFDDDDDDDDDDEEDHVEEENRAGSESESKSAGPPRPPRSAALLASINKAYPGAGGRPAPASAGLLGAIQGFNKAGLGNPSTT